MIKTIIIIIIIIIIIVILIIIIIKIIIIIIIKIKIIIIIIIIIIVLVDESTQIETKLSKVLENSTKLHFLYLYILDPNRNKLII